MKHLTQLKTWLAMCLLFVGVGASWAESKTVTYTITSATTVAISGTVPAGSSAAFMNTHTSNKEQLTSGDKMTLTLSGFDNLQIAGLTLSMKSNSKAGAGYLLVTAGKNKLASIGSTNSGVGFNDSKWNGAYTDSYTNVTPTLSKSDYTIQDNETVTIVIGATANSLYCQSFTITYEEKPYESEFILTEIFSETFGEGANNVNVTDYSGWTGTGTIYSGSAKVGNTNSNVCDLPNSSGEGYFYMSSGNINEFVISGLNTSNLSNVKMTFNYRGANADAKFKIECSTDGGANYEKLANSTDMSTKWQTSSEYEIPASDNLCIKFILLEITIGDYRTVYFDDLKIKASSTTLKTATPEGYATFYSDKAIILPEGITAATASTDANGSLVWNWVYNEGDNVPAGTPILVKGNEGAKSYTAFESNTLASAPAINYLKANNTAFNKQASTLANSTDKFYVLSYNASHENLGFYWYTANGDGNFSVPAGKVVLALPSNGGNAKAGFALDGDEVAIQEAKAEDTNKITYNLYGQRTKANHNGLYIVNGKKIIIK